MDIINASTDLKPLTLEWCSEYSTPVLLPLIMTVKFYCNFLSVLPVAASVTQTFDIEMIR